MRRPVISSRRSRVVAAVFVASAVAAACTGGDSDATPDLSCGETAGRTVEHAIPALDSEADRALVHLPPCYDAGTARYPTVWLMHGGGGTAEMWTSARLDAPGTIDALTADGRIAPVLTVMPHGVSGRPAFIGADGGVAEFDVVLAEIDASFRTRAEPAARVIAGVSAGGTTAAYLAAESEATDFAGLGLFMSVWGPSLDERFPAGVGDADLKPAVLVDIGEDDGLRTYSDDMAAAFDAAGVDADMQVHPGGHDLEFVVDRFPDWIVWLVEQF